MQLVSELAPNAAARDMRALLERQRQAFTAELPVSAAARTDRLKRAVALVLDIPAIFVTAYRELLLTGETAEPTYLISKPYDSATLRVSIFQALFFRDPAWRQRRPAA